MHFYFYTEHKSRDCFIKSHLVCNLGLTRALDFVMLSIDNSKNGNTSWIAKRLSRLECEYCIIILCKVIFLLIIILNNKIRIFFIYILCVHDCMSVLEPKKINSNMLTKECDRIL